MGRAPKHERQHPDPGDLIDERRDRRSERDDEQWPPQWSGADPLDLLTLTLGRDWRLARHTSVVGSGDQRDDSRRDDIEESRHEQRPGKPKSANQDESGDE